MNAYCVEYKMHPTDETHKICLLANNKADAYDKATYDLIPKNMEGIPYSSWVASVTYNNGNYRLFNNFEGKPY